MLWFCDQCYHAVRLARLGIGFPGACSHYLSPPSNHLHGERVIKISSNDQRGVFSQTVSKRNVDPFFCLESKLFLENSQDHNRRGHDGWLRIFSLIELRVWTVDNRLGQLAPEDLVGLVPKGPRG